MAVVDASIADVFSKVQVEDIRITVDLLGVSSGQCLQSAEIVCSFPLPVFTSSCLSQPVIRIAVSI